MARLNQVIAVEKGVKAKTYGELTALNKAAQKPDLFNGFQKSYQPLAEDGEKLPAESKRVQYTSTDVLRATARSLTELMEVTARKDWTNCAAKATVKIDDVVLFENAPVSFLLFMEKQVTDLRTLIGNLPVLDIADDWKLDQNSGFYKTDPQQTHRSKKEQRPLVLYNATPEHPAQTQLITEDVLAGYWSLVKQSGAIPGPKKQELLVRVEKLLNALKEARETANMFDVVDSPDVGAAVFGYLLQEKGA